MISFRLVHILTLEHFSFHCIQKRNVLWHLCICRFSVLTFCIMESLHISRDHTLLSSQSHQTADTINLPRLFSTLTPPPLPQITCTLSHTHNTQTQVPLSEKRNVLIGNNIHNSVTSLFLLSSACGFHCWLCWLGLIKAVIPGKFSCPCFIDSEVWEQPGRKDTLLVIWIWITMHQSFECVWTFCLFYFREKAYPNFQSGNCWPVNHWVIGVCICMLKWRNRRQAVPNLVRSLCLALRQRAWEARQTSRGMRAAFPPLCSLAFILSLHVSYALVFPALPYPSPSLCLFCNCLLVDVSVPHRPYPAECCSDLITFVLLFL